MKTNPISLKIQYPYIPKDRVILYVSSNNEFIQAAKDFARQHSLDDVMPTGSVVVKDGRIIGIGANGSDYHKTHECARIKQNIPTGKGYELCEGCHPKNHSERRAVEDAERNGSNVDGADLYLWGHYWCCKPCWDKMIASKIKNVFLMEGSEILFNKSSEKNIIGHQFDEKNNT
jgi:deoxycytidylate deaminase